MNALIQYPWDTPAVPATAPEAVNIPTPRPKPRGRRPAARVAAIGQGPRTAPDWLYHHLTISGPVDQVERFAAAAGGAGVVPWRLAGAEIEETVFNLAVSQPARDRALTVEGCRILARQFRDRVEAHQAKAAMQVGVSRACPFDLHTLLPVPDAILQLGPTHPQALAWLAAHWGITDRLRQVTVRTQASSGRRLPNGHTVIGYGFFSSGETPQVAITRLEVDWPRLRFQLVPRLTD